MLYEMNIRQLTEEGTISAAIKHLPRLKELGIDAIWLMPIYPIGKVERKGSLGSYYSVADYCDISDEMGTFEQFDTFVAEAHNLGMKIILDWVDHNMKISIYDRDPMWTVMREGGPEHSRGEIGTYAKRLAGTSRDYGVAALAEKYPDEMDGIPKMW